MDSNSAREVLNYRMDNNELQDAIDHCYDVVLRSNNCLQCKIDHIKLANALAELRRYRELAPMYSSNPEC